MGDKPKGGFAGSWEAAGKSKYPLVKIMVKNGSHAALLLGEIPQAPAAGGTPGHEPQNSLLADARWLWGQKGRCGNRDRKGRGKEAQNELGWSSMD